MIINYEKINLNNQINLKRPGIVGDAANICKKLDINRLILITSFSDSDDDETILEALSELDKNTFGESLIVYASRANINTVLTDAYTMFNFEYACSYYKDDEDEINQDGFIYKNDVGKRVIDYLEARTSLQNIKRLTNMTAKDYNIVLNEVVPDREMPDFFKDDTINIDINGINIKVSASKNESEDK